MDNYRKFKTSRSRSSAVDGFVTVPGKHRKDGIGGRPRKSDFVIGSGRTGRSRRPNPPTAISKKTTNRPKLGNFKQADGLHSFEQGIVGFGAETTAPPALGRKPARDEKGRIKLSPHGLDKPRLKHKRNWRKLIKRASLSLVAIILLGGVYFGVKTYLQSRKILAGGGNAAALEENVDPTLLNGEGDGRVNVLMLGKGGVGHEAPDLTDTILIASIDPTQKEAALVSIPRDLYVKTPTSGSMKINAVYATAKNKVLAGKKVSDQKKKAEEAGFKAAEDAVEGFLGIPIHYHAMVDFTGFKQAVDAVGGVDINVPTAVFEQMRIDGRPYTLNVKTGQQHFDGFRALAYSRSRYTSARGDFDRAERQRLVLVALKNKAFSLGTLSNPIKVNDLLSALGDHVQTNFSLDEIMRVREIGQGIDSSKIESIGLADPPNNYLTTSNISGQSVVVPRAGLYNYKEIQSFIRNRLRDGYLKQENASVLILNGTTISGLATRTSEELKSYGYNLLPATDAPTKTYQNTVLVDMRAGAKKYTKHYLEKRFGVSAVTSLPDPNIVPGTADFVIILGTNEQSRLED